LGHFMSMQKLIAGGGAIEVALFQQAGADPYTASAERDAQIAEVADIVASFVTGANSTLDIAIYDFRLDGVAREKLKEALTGRAAAGVAIRILFDAAAPVDRGDGDSGNDLAPAGSAEFLCGLALQAETKGITGRQQRRYSKNALMHQKYIIRDAMSPGAAVLCGSTNFTNDAFGLQENNILILRSHDLSSYYAADFADLWDHGEILPSSGFEDTATVAIGGVQVTVDFAPGQGQSIIREAVQAIDAAQERITIASMLITSGPVLAALSEALDRGLPVEGVCDGTQMAASMAQLQESGVGQDRIAAWAKLRPHLAQKQTVKYAPDAPHDFMHIKALVADNTVVTGSFNFSNSARGNAENLLIIRDEDLAGGYRAYIQSLIARYGGSAGK